MTRLQAIPPPPDTDSNEPKLTITGHLEELRRRLGISLAALLIAVAISFARVERIIRWLQRPIQPMLPRFAFFSPTEPLIAYIKVALLAGMILAMPVILWQVWGFVRPGLTKRERAYGVTFIGWSSVQFVAGVAFAYFFLLPASLRFLLGIGSGVLEPMISLDRYVAFSTTLIFWCGLVFELPVILFVLALVGVVTPEWLRQQRAYAILVLAIVAAVVTPTTDPVNMILLMIPMVFLYELSIWITHVAIRRRPLDSVRR